MANLRPPTRVSAANQSVSSISVTTVVALVLVTNGSKPVENTEAPDMSETLSIRKPLPALAGTAVPLARKSSESTVRVSLPSQSRK